MRFARILLSISLSLFVCVGCWAAAQEVVTDDEPFMTGVVIDASMNALLIRQSDGTETAFSAGEADKSGLKNGLMIGNVVVVTYEGDKALALSDGSLFNTCLPMKDEEPVEFDLDGDGALEVVSLRWQYSKDMGENTAALTVTDDDGEAVYATDIVRGTRVLIASLDEETQTPDVLISGDVMSDDHVTWRLRYENGALTLMGEPNSGEVETCLYGEVLVGDWVDVLGTRWCTARFQIDESGALAKPADEIWTVKDADSDDMWEYSALETILPLPVTLTDGETETEGELPVGTKLIITGTDGSSVAYFVTSEGVSGKIAISPSASEGWGSDIAGKFEGKYFAFLPYSG